MNVLCFVIRNCSPEKADGAAHDIQGR
jgi:hypothetical protein